MLSRLSSYLYELTSNKTYEVAAELSAQFIWEHLYNNMIVLDGIMLGNCSPTSVRPLSYNSGKVMEGLSSVAKWDSTWGPRYKSEI